MQLSELIQNCGPETYLDTVAALSSLARMGFVTYNPESMEVDLTPLGVLVNQETVGNA